MTSILSDLDTKVDINISESEVDEKFESILNSISNLDIGSNLIVNLESTTNSTINPTIYFSKFGKKFQKSNGSRHQLCSAEDCFTRSQPRKDYCAKHDPDNVLTEEQKLERTKKRSENIKTSRQKGDDTENFIYDLINENPDIEMVEKLSYLFDQADIIFKFKNDVHTRALQVKMLGTRSHTKHIRSTGCNGYPDDMLLVFVNEERTKFALMFARDITTTGISINFESPFTKYYEYSYTNIDKFKEDLFDKMSKSLVYDKENPLLPEMNLKEYQSLKRLIELCEKHNLEYKLPDNKYSIFDMTINGYLCQCKYTNFKEKQKFIVSISKSHTNVGEVGKSVPYSVDDKLDFVIVETSDNDFFIIPRFEFVKRHIFSDIENNIPGLVKMSVCPKNIISHSSYLWTLKYQDNFNLLKSKPTDNLESLLYPNGETIISNLEIKEKRDMKQKKKDEIVFDRCKGICIRYKDGKRYYQCSHMVDVNIGYCTHHIDQNPIFEQSLIVNKVPVGIKETPTVIEEIPTINTPILITTIKCKGKSSKGKECTRTVSADVGFCCHHLPQGPVTDNVCIDQNTTTKCKGTNVKKQPCMRLVDKNIGYCNYHKNQKPANDNTSVV